MERSSFYSEIETEGRMIRCSYRVIQQGKHTYGLFCSQEGATDRHTCCIRNITSNEETAEALAGYLAEKQVMPVHIQDVIQDLLP